jgi:hypothetical protein
MRNLIGCVILTSACGGGSGATSSTAWEPDTATSSSAGDDTADIPEPDGTSSGAADSAPDPSVTVGEDSGSESSDGGPVCLEATAPCVVGTDVAQCCADLECGTTSLGQVCCGNEGTSCATENGEDCCGDLLCIAGTCGYNLENVCESPCTAAPALTLEKQRLEDIGGSFLGICGDANHTYGYHVPAANLPESDYSMEGAANDPVCEWHAAAIDIGMDWDVSRDWLAWLIVQIQTDAITGVAEVIGSYDGVNVRYWSDSAGWSTEGIPYTGEGHDSWTHVSIYRSTTLEDHGILAGWTATQGP